MTNNNLEKGRPWRFGPDWPGQRCGAKTRRGTSCQAPAKQPVGCCRVHGGASTGPRTKDGLARLVASKTTHGKFTAEKRAAVYSQWLGSNGEIKILNPNKYYAGVGVSITKRFLSLSAFQNSTGIFISCQAMISKSSASERGPGMTEVIML